jgi:CheY-like chemotaxis protein
MKKMTQEIKRMLEALAVANVGDSLTRRQMTRHLAGKPAPVSKPEAPVLKTQQAQVGLYLGSELSADVMQYVVQTCSRLKHGLSVLSFQSENEVQALLAPYQEALAEAGIETRVTILTGEPPAALVHALRRRPDIAFLICNESGYLGRSLIKGTVRQDAIPVPVVLVTASETAAQPAQKEAATAQTRAA